MADIRVLIVEDQVLTAENLAFVLEDAEYEVVGMYDTGEEVIKDFESLNPDVVIMDIGLAGQMDGIETAWELKRKYDVPIIFLSNYRDEEHVNRAKKVKPESYLVKPFDEQQVVIAIEMALSKFFDIGIKTETPHLEQSRFLLNRKLFVRTERGYSALEIDQIYYIVADGSYCKIITSDGNFTISSNLNSISEKLEKHDFIRVHRSYLVNFEYIDHLEEGYVFVKGQNIPIGKTHRKQVLSKLNLV